MNRRVFRSNERCSITSSAYKNSYQSVINQENKNFPLQQRPITRDDCVYDQILKQKNLETLQKPRTTQGASRPKQMLCNLGILKDKFLKIIILS